MCIIFNAWRSWYLFWWGGHCCLMHCDLFKIYCAPPNFGIRTWIYRLNLTHRPIFSGLRFFNKPEISDSGPERTCAQDFYVLKTSINLIRVWTREPWISRRARYPESTEVDYWCINLYRNKVSSYYGEFNVLVKSWRIEIKRLVFHYTRIAYQ